MNIVAVAAALVIGFLLGVVICKGYVRYLRNKVKALRAGEAPVNILRSVTRLIFVTTQISALVWVFTSYGIAIYSTICLGQVYTMAELSEPAIHTILGVGVLKVLENIFEHNEGAVFGKSKPEESPPPESGDEEGVG